MVVDEVLRLLGEQETMCRAEVERLEVEQARLAGLLATCRVELERLVVAREIIAGLVPVPPVAATASAGGGYQRWRTPTSGSSCRLSWPLIRVRCGAGRSSRLGEGTRGRHGVRVRHRMKKLAAADLVIEAVPGEFTLADGRDPAFR